MGREGGTGARGEGNQSTKIKCKETHNDTWGRAEEESEGKVGRGCWDSSGGFFGIFVIFFFLSGFSF